MLWGSHSRSQINFAATELDEAEDFWDVLVTDRTGLLRSPPETMNLFPERLVKLIDLDLSEDTCRRTLEATVPFCDLADWQNVPAETKFQTARAVSRLSVRPEERTALFYDELAAFLETLSHGTSFTKKVSHWALERWDQRPASVYPRPFGLNIDGARGG